MTEASPTSDRPSYVHRTEPYGHQRDATERSLTAEGFALFMEQGTGKTKVVVDTAATLHTQASRPIDGLLVVAPNGVHRNWVTDELPAHMAESVRWAGLAYYASRATTAGQRREAEALLSHRGLAVLTMTYDAIMTESGRGLARKFLTQRRCMLVLDESHYIKSPSAKRTKAIRAARTLAPYRRILTGTPVANSPFDVYAPVRFLDDDYWRPHGIVTFLNFQHEFGVFGHMTANGRKVERVVAYKNLDKLHAMLAPISHRVLKADCLDLPEKVYQRRPFEMSPVQRRVYQDLRDEYRAILASGEEVTAPLAMVRLLRLQQIASGYAPADESSELVPIDDGNPRLRAFLEAQEEAPGKGIVWARFSTDIDLITRALGGRAVRYDGRVSDRDRTKALDDWRSKDSVQWFVANQAAAGTGLTLNEAGTVVYYTNSFNLTHRLQSEDRCHRAGQTKSVTYQDLVAEGTVDERILSSLRSKRDVAAQVMGDGLREWI